MTATKQAGASLPPARTGAGVDQEHQGIIRHGAKLLRQEMAPRKHGIRPRSQRPAVRVIPGSPPGTAQRGGSGGRPPGWHGPRISGCRIRGSRSGSTKRSGSGGCHGSQPAS